MQKRLAIFDACVALVCIIAFVIDTLYNHITAYCLFNGECIYHYKWGNYHNFIWLLVAAVYLYLAICWYRRDDYFYTK